MLILTTAKWQRLPVYSVTKIRGKKFKIDPNWVSVHAQKFAQISLSHKLVIFDYIYSAISKVYHKVNESTFSL